ncbi:Pimeloyl-ACP methyl ester carboxylesterase [Novosphingobium sp. CF614]|uniref:alpha/beta fold hydrolase n=1 Tax=Novosphingobium sp. CF614 TaxID=1884364 RepID=UPI0008F3A247|nr:alpha/beta fold hydrolase [Novosphingobium sp. CF614]SFF84476.1 Pimeloyl-ACP methyl ester carboxylesterase [Novosphingobium sp. CF614]
MRFVLVHGGLHGAWCWERVIPELRALGHQAIAIDLPGHATRAEEEVTLATRRQALVEVIEPGDVLVGHSAGGYDITLAADAVPERIGHLVYLAGLPPVEGKSLIEAGRDSPVFETDESGGTQMAADDSGTESAIAINAQGAMECVDFAKTWAMFYHDCDEDSARWAFERLTPMPIGFLQEIVNLPRFWRTDPPRSYVHCLQDRVARPRQREYMAHRLGVEPLVIDASHSPFLSRPRETAECLVRAAATRPVGPLLPR